MNCSYVFGVKFMNCPYIFGAVGWVEERNPTQLFKSVGFHYRSTQPTIY